MDGWGECVQNQDNGQIACVEVVLGYPILDCNTSADCSSKPGYICVLDATTERHCHPLAIDRD